MALVVLGAGATRASRFVKKVKGKEEKYTSFCAPPLNSDFFTQMQRITDDKYMEAISGTISATCDIFGKNFNLTMEDLFTQLEFMLRSFQLVKIRKKRGLETIEKLRKLRKSLFESIFAVFEYSVHKPFQDEYHCEFHKNLIGALNNDDSIISFNYDCLIDETLKEFGGRKWDPKWSYCFPSHNYRHVGFEHWKKDATTETTKKETIKLLKVHGSINWKIKEFKENGDRGEITLRERLWHQKGYSHYTIIPPEWNKDIVTKASIFNKIWSEAAKRIAREDKFIFIGFSFTPTDLHAASLFQVAVSKINTLIIVNPDKEARYRTRKILNKGIGCDTRIFQFDKFEEFARDKQTIKDYLNFKTTGS